MFTSLYMEYYSNGFYKIQHFVTKNVNISQKVRQ